MNSNQERKIRDKINELKNKNNNSNAIIKQSLYDIDKIINNHNLAFIREQLKEKQNHIDKNRNELKLLETKKRNINKTISNIPNTYINKLDEERNILESEINRIEQKKLENSEELIADRIQYSNLVIECETNLLEKKQQLQEQEHDLQEYSRINQHSRHSILNQMLEIKTIKKKRINEIKVIDKQITTILNQISENELLLDNVIPFQRREANVKYYEYKDKISILNSELEQVENWISETVDDINRLQSNIRNVNTELIAEKQEHLVQYWDMKENVIIKLEDCVSYAITGEDDAEIKNINKIFEELDNKELNVKNEIVILKDQLTQFTELKLELKGAKMPDDPPLSITQEQLISKKKQIASIKLEILYIEENISKYMEKLDDLDKLIDYENKVLVEDEKQSHMRWDIMQYRIEEWKHTASDDLQKELLELDIEIKTGKEYIADIDASRHIIETELDQKLGSDIARYRQLQQIIVTNNKLIAKSNNEIDGLLRLLTV